MLLPLAALLLVEGGLRLAGYGETYPLFVPVRQAPSWLQVNPGVIRRFVVDEADTPKLWIRPVAFRPEKPPGTFRIFVQGGSSAAGYPYGYGASPAGMLQQRLQRTFPDRRIEVITTAVSAVNSYTLLDFSREILEQHPDAIVVYAGHNEYLGLLGVGSTFSAGRRRPLVLSFLALREMRLLQLGRHALDALVRRPRPRDRRTLMARVVGEDQIPYGSALYRRGLAQFRANLRALLARYREAGVPVWIGTVVSNERDQPPFLSGHARGVDVAAWRRHFDAGLAALRKGDAAAALRDFDAAVAIDDLHADVHFGRGRALEALGATTRRATPTSPPGTATSSASARRRRSTASCAGWPASRAPTSSRSRTPSTVPRSTASSATTSFSSTSTRTSTATSSSPTPSTKRCTRTG